MPLSRVCANYSTATSIRRPPPIPEDAREATILLQDNGSFTPVTLTAKIVPLSENPIAYHFPIIAEVRTQPSTHLPHVPCLACLACLSCKKYFPPAPRGNSSSPLLPGAKLQKPSRHENLSFGP